MRAPGAEGGARPRGARPSRVFSLPGTLKNQVRANCALHLRKDPEMLTFQIRLNNRKLSKSVSSDWNSSSKNLSSGPQASPLPPRAPPTPASAPFSLPLLLSGGGALPPLRAPPSLLPPTPAGTPSGASLRVWTQPELLQILQASRSFIALHSVVTDADPRSPEGTWNQPRGRGPRRQ